MHELGGMDDLLLRYADLVAHAREARRARLQVGDAIDVVIGHGDGEILRRRGRQHVGLRSIVPLEDAAEQREILLAIGEILEIDDALQARRQHVVRLGRERGLRTREQRGVARPRRRDGRCDLLGRGSRQRHRRPRALIAQRKAAQARLDADAGLADGRLVSLARKRQCACAGERAEHHRRDRAAARLRGGGHVECDEPLRSRFRCGDDRTGVADAVAGGLLFDDRIGSVRRGDERRAVGRDEAALDGAARFHEFGADDDVDLARYGHQRQHRPKALGRIRRQRQRLDVIDGCAGALRDARHRRRLRHPTLRLAQRHDPVD